MTSLKNPGRDRILAILLIPLLSVTTGCSLAPTADQIMPTQLQVAKHYPYTVSLEVRGDEDYLKSVELERAIESTILNQKIFAKVVQGGGDYRLVVDADVTPSGALDAISTVGGTWRLYKTDTGKIVMDEFVTVSHTVTIGEEFIGYQRVKLARALTVKKYIEEGMRRLANLHLP